MMDNVLIRVVLSFRPGVFGTSSPLKLLARDSIVCVPLLSFRYAAD